MIDLYKICKPYISIPFEPYITASDIYTVSKDRANKVYKILYGIPCKFLDNETSTCMAISGGLVLNDLPEFLSVVGEFKHGDN